MSGPRRAWAHRGSATCERRLRSRSRRVNGTIEVTVRLSLVKTTRKTPHETDDNVTCDSLHSHKHVRAGARPRTGWVRNSHGSFSGFVHGSGGHDKCSPHMGEHWSCSASAQQPDFCSNACAEPSSHGAGVRGSQVKKIPAFARGLFTQEYYRRRPP